MSARVSVDASRSTVVHAPDSYGFADRSLSVDLSVDFDVRDAVLAERLLEQAIEAARADLRRFLPS